MRQRALYVYTTISTVILGHRSLLYYAVQLREFGSLRELIIMPLYGVDSFSIEFNNFKVDLLKRLSLSACNVFSRRALFLNKNIAFSSENDSYFDADFTLNIIFVNIPRL